MKNISDDESLLV